MAVSILAIAAGLILMVNLPAARAQLETDNEQVRAAIRQALALETRGKTAEAAREFEQAVDLARRLIGPDDLTTAALMRHLARLYESQHRHAEAELSFRGALEIREAKLGRDHLTVAESLNDLSPKTLLV